jgi:hypothetical protein
LRKPPRKPPRLLRRRTYRNLHHRFFENGSRSIELEVAQQQTPEEFFRVRPYLQPPVFWPMLERLKKFDPAFYREATGELKAVLISALKKGRRGRRPLTPREIEMLFTEIAKRRKLKLPICPPEAASKPQSQAESEPPALPEESAK